ncbi:MAG: Unknown protein [uncultured Sulfurovum sp.]|uniref:Outer membrane protein beta-barrel domain-containing protein n=1 Tax=uncultured Sulfurovum sp. TaxID=269237 RepID=A0A6S6SLE5_9BACT|nr:MAG: Unknown protein [uncultured Sulfurovum sp.]
MQKLLLILLLLPLSLLAIDNDFDGVEDDVDACLETAMLDTVTADGCSQTQKKSMDIMLLQTFSYLKVDDNSHLTNYNIALMLNKDDWFFYVGSGYFRYETQKDITDTTFLAQKSFALSSSHYLKASLSAIIPTYTSEGNKMDYSSDLSYLFAHKAFNVEVGYRYEMINDEGIDDRKLAFVYLGYAFDKLHTVLGYSQDNQEQKNYNLLLQYNLNSDYALSYSFTKTDNNFYETMHTLGVGYHF